MSAGLGPFYLKFAAEVRIIPRPARAAMREGHCLPMCRAPSLPFTGEPGALGCRAAVRCHSLPDGP